ncbi:cullin [Martiniozyma asiatica (nom. inval.)]|nr:cullin [Martiniozyma asiatica]
MKQRIVAPKRSPLLDKSSAWDVLEPAFKDIMQLKQANWQYAPLYTAAYNLVLGKNGQFLYDKINSVLCKFVNERKEFVKNIIDIGDLRALKKMWDDYLLAVQLISYVGMYLDRTFVKENQLPSIYDLGLMNYRDVIYDDINEGLIKLFVDQFDLARHGQVVDKLLIKSLLKMFESLIDQNGISYFKKYLEPAFYVKSHEYFLEMVLELDTLSNYPSGALKFLKHEFDLHIQLLPIETHQPLKDLAYNDIILNHIEIVLDDEMNGLASWIELELPELSDIYTLLNIPSGMSILQTRIRKNILYLAEFEDSEKKSKQSLAVDYISHILKLRAKFLRILQQHFHLDPIIEREIENSFTSIANKKNKFTEFLSLYISHYINNSDTIIFSIEETIALVTYLKDKDMFEAYYKQHLARRLLSTNNNSLLDGEISVLTKLKIELGSHFTQSLEGMIKDITNSQTLSNEFLNINDNSISSIDFSPTLLTTANWPTQPSTLSGITLPTEMRNITKIFEDWYSEKFEGRRLHWCNVGHVTVSISISERKRKAIMSPICAIILQCFDDDSSITLNLILQRTGIDPTEAIKSLVGLMSGKTRFIINKISLPMTESGKKRIDLRKNAELIINDNWKSKESKVKVSLPSAIPPNILTDIPTSNNKKESVENQLLVERGQLVDSAIVRVMKSRKLLAHETLVLAVGDILKSRFEVTGRLIKERLSNLLDEGYLEREEGNYKYIA